jgi:hypothetical protein
MSQLPRTIEKLSLAGCRVSNSAISAPGIGDSSKIREMFPHLTEVDLSGSDLGWSLFKHLGFSPWSTRVKKFIIHGSSGVWGDRVVGFPKNEQNCLVESQDLTDLLNIRFRVKKILVENENMLYSPYYLPLSVIFV